MTDLLNALVAKIEFGDCWNWTAALRPERRETLARLGVTEQTKEDR